MASDDADRMLIESMMPQYDAMIAEHLVVRAHPAAVFRAAQTLDFRTVSSPLLAMSMWIRGLPQRVCGKVVDTPANLVLDEVMALPGWLLLGQDDREIAFGAVGKFWQPVIEWRQIPQAEFAAFAEPGWGKIAANFSVTPYGEQTLLSYQCRTVTTDPRSRRRFLRYWRLIRPFVAHIMRATLATIGAKAEHPASAGKL